jgi:predicted extracellular nuclease
MEFTVASANLERFFNTVNDGTSEPVLTPAAYANRKKKVSLAIRNFMGFPDILAVEEMENLTTLQDLASTVNADAAAAMQPDPMYQAYLVEGNDVGGIDVGFLVKTAEVQTGVPRVGVVDVVQENKLETFTNPDSSTVLLNDRPPLRLRAVLHHPNGTSFAATVIVVHQRSLSSVDSTAAGSNGWATEGARVRAKRQKQAESLANLVQTRQTNDPAERIVVLGDFNAFEVSDGYVDAMGTVLGAPTAAPRVVLASSDLVNPDLTNLHDTPPADQRYSYVFDGNAQTLDHVLVNSALVSSTTARRIEHARINADFPETFRNDPNRAERYSDHDPVVAYFQVATFPVSLTRFTAD